MHGMLSLGILVAAVTAFAGWAAFVSVRLYRACPAGRSGPEPRQPEEPGTTPQTMA